MSIFKACDIRGSYPDEIENKIVFKIGKAFGALVKNKTVIVAGDVRISTEDLKYAVISALVESGCFVVDIGIVPTPVFNFSLRHLNIENGIMVTASHNPAKYNGLKLIINGFPAIDEDMERIKTLIKSGKFVNGKGNINKREILSDYERFILKRFEPNKLKLVFDIGNGSYSGIASEILKELKINFSALFDSFDGNFPNRNPNPAIAENLGILRKTVLEKKADLGVAFDGDGDRVAFVDEKGNACVHDRMIALLAGYLLKDNPKSNIVYDQKCSDIVPETIIRSKGIPLAEQSGHSFIRRRMKKENAIFGGEISGHYFYRELSGADDGLFTALLVSLLIEESGKGLSNLLKEIPENFSTPDLRVPVKDLKFKDIEKIIKSKYSKNKIDEIDGIKVHFENGWALIRPSITEPVMTIRFDAKNKEDLGKIMLDVLDNFKDLKEEISKKYSKYIEGL